MRLFLVQLGLDELIRTAVRVNGMYLVRVRRIVLIAAIAALIPVLVSYTIAMSEPSNSSLGIRTVEWLRDNGAAGLVAKVESIYYSLTAPAKGGPTLHSLPHVGTGGVVSASQSTSVAAQAIQSEYRPPPVPALLHPALPGEGVWHATRTSLNARPPVLVTTIRDQPEYPRVLAGLAWMNTSRTRLTLNPGRLEPSVELPRGPMEVPLASRQGLLATFNSGFKLSDDHGGFVLHGTTYAEMHNGQGTLVGYSDGRVNVVDWNHGPRAPAGVSFARQNLPLLVEEGRLNPAIDNTAEWGATVENAVLVWRSGIGVDRYGNLIYAAGEDQTVASLARVLQRAGAVRAMELDINSYWVSFITYGAPRAGEPSNLLPGMERPDTRYLEPDDRDFFAVYER
jgi:Phosphodiester glycosidase